MSRKLKVVKAEMTNVNYYFLGAFRLQLTVEESVGMEKEIFLYQRDPINPNTGNQVEFFVTVCSPVDMAEFPVDDPDIEKPYPYFRASVLTLDFRSSEEFEAAYDDIMERIENLVAALDRMDILEPTQTTWVGGEPENTDTGTATV